MSLSVSQSALCLQQGGVLAYPTEAVWGLGCDPFNQRAFETILQLKRRDPAKGVIVLFANYAQLAPYLSSPIQIQQGPRVTSYLVNIKPGAMPSWIMGQHAKLAVRICEHQLVQQLIHQSGRPLVSTSLNPQGKQPAKHAFQVWRYFRAALQQKQLQICQGSVGNELRPSRIIDAESQRILRH